MNNQAITLTIELKHKHNNQPVQLKATTTPDEHESDKQLIDRLMAHKQLSFKDYELVDYQIEPAQIELF